MKKTAYAMIIVFTLVLGITLLPTLTRAAEYSFAGPPAFTVTYSDGSPKDKTGDQVWAIITGGGLHVEVSVGAPPAGIDLKDYAEKAYMPSLMQTQGAKAKMSDNKEFTLSDGTKAYYSEVDWTHPPTGAAITTMMVTVYKDGKYVNVAAHPWDNYGAADKIVKSLKFK